MCITDALRSSTALRDALRTSCVACLLDGPSFIDKFRSTLLLVENLQVWGLVRCQQKQ